MKKRIVILMFVLLIVSTIAGCSGKSTSFSDDQVLDKREFRNQLYKLRNKKTSDMYNIANIYFGKKSDYSFSDSEGIPVDKAKSGNIMLFTEKTKHSVYTVDFYNAYVLSDDVIVFDEDVDGIFHMFPYIENIYFSNVDTSKAKAAGITTEWLFYFAQSDTALPQRIVVNRSKWKLDLSGIKKGGTKVEYE